MPSCEVLTWILGGHSDQARRLQNHLILRHLDIEDHLHQWRRSIAERRNLNEYNIFFAEVQAKQKTGKQTRRSGERSSSKAHMEYLDHIYADRKPKNYQHVKQGLQKDLRNGRRWSILIDGIIADDGNRVPGLGLGFLLFCGSAAARKMSITPLRYRRPAEWNYRYNTTKYSDPYLKALLTYIHRLHADIQTTCEALQTAAESLVNDGKLCQDFNLNMVALGLRQFV